MKKELPIMVKKKKKKKAGKRKPRKGAIVDRFQLIENALRKQTKADIIDLLLLLAKEDAPLARDLENRLAIEKPVELLSADVSSAIDRATDFDDRLVNHNFDCDWQAYADVEQGLKNLIKLGQLEGAKTLALKLMKHGSYQVGCSDEGLMTDKIQDCLKPVIRAVKTKGGSSAGKWALKMLRADRVGFICENELKQLAE